MLYNVRGAFSVRYGTVRCTVEGTRFQVEGGDTVKVGVLRGRVKVETPSGEQLIKKSQQVEISADGTMGETQEWSLCYLCGIHHTPY